MNTGEKMMKALWQYDNGILEFREVEEPQIQEPDDIKIKVMYSTIGIQDLRMSRKWDFYSKQGIAGYEMAGIICGLGESAITHGFYIGQRISGTVIQFCGKCVYCKNEDEQNCIDISINTGTLCPYVVWKEKQCEPLPDNVSFKTGCLLEPVAVVLMAFKKLNIEKNESLCIFGGDFNGLILLQLAKYAGASKITMIEKKAFNRDLADKFGADYILDPLDDAYETELLKITDFEGFQKVAVTSSDPSFIRSSVNAASRGADVLFTVYFEDQKSIEVNSVKFFAMNLNLSSSFLYTRKVLSDAGRYLSKLSLDELIMKEFHARDILQAFSDEQKYRAPRIGIMTDF